MTPRARYFVLLTLGLVVGLAGGLALLNYLVDPYDRFGHNRLGVYISADRECKSTEVRRYPHNALLLGNSRMGVVPPEQLNSFRFFNGAFAGATTEEVYYFALHYALGKELEVVILSVDPGQEDPAQLKGDIFVPANCNSILNNLLNLQTVEYSFRTILDHLEGIPSPMKANGFFDMAGWVKATDQERPAYRDWQLEQLKLSYGRFSNPARERLSFYVRLAECLRQRGITCVVLVPPFHEEVAKHVRSLPDCAAAYQQWKQELDTIFPYIVDLSYSSYGAAENYYRSDPAHFRSEVGVRMLNSEVIPVALRVLQKRTKR